MTTKCQNYHLEKDQQTRHPPRVPLLPIPIPSTRAPKAPLARTPWGAAELCAEPCRLTCPRFSPQPGMPRGDLEVTFAGSATASGVLGCSRHNSWPVALRGLLAGPIPLRPDPAHPREAGGRGRGHDRDRDRGTAADGTIQWGGGCQWVDML